MTVILDTSFVIPITRAKGSTLMRVREVFKPEDLFIASIVEMEILMGARDHSDWKELTIFLGLFDILHPAPADWRAAGRTFFELRRVGQTVRSALDCLLAEIAMRHDMLLVHNDKDLEKIAMLRPLKQRRIDLETLA